MPSRDDTQRLFLNLARFGASLSSALADEVGQEYSSNVAIIVLFHLDREGPTRPGTLQEVVGYTSGGLSRLLERLEEQGVIERTFGALTTDRRAVLVGLTPKGRSLARRAADVLSSHLAQLQVHVKEMADLLDPDHG